MNSLIRTHKLPCSFIHSFIPRLSVRVIYTLSQRVAQEEKEAEALREQQELAAAARVSESTVAQEAEFKHRLDQV